MEETGRTFHPGEVDLVELLLGKPAQLDHLLHGHAELARRPAFGRRAQLLDLGQNALDASLDVLLVELRLGRAEPP